MSIENLIVVKTIKIAEVFKTRLASRPEANEFRRTYLPKYDSITFWRGYEKVELDFQGVNTISPGFADQLFRYYFKYNVSPQTIYNKLHPINISRVGEEIIKIELEIPFP